MEKLQSWPLLQKFQVDFLASMLHTRKFGAYEYFVYSIRNRYKLDSVEIPPQVFHQKQQVGQRKAVLNQELLQTEVRGDSSQVFYQKQQVCPSLFGRSYCDY